MQIKICGLNNIGNIASVLSLRPDYIGFIFHKGSKRYIDNSPALADYIANINITKKTGVFVNASQNEIAAAIYRYKLDVVQLHGAETPAACSMVPRGVTVIKAFCVDKSFDFNITAAYTNCCDYFLFDTASNDYGGTGRSFDWSLLSNYTIGVPFFLSGGIGPEHASRLKKTQYKSLFAIDINSRFETTAGIKNINLLKSFIHELRN